MSHQGDLDNAREVYVNGQNKNLRFLLASRSFWMNNFISKDFVGVELGAGIGASRDYVECQKLILTDFNDSPWLDEKNVDALHTNFADESFDFILASNMIHHLAFPRKFFNECSRILKPGGLLLVQEIHTSLFMRIILRLTRHEGFDETVEVFDETVACNDPSDPWSANCAVPKLLFKNHGVFESHFQDWQVVYDEYVEFLQFLNSGGVVAKTKYLKLGPRALKFESFLDRVICRAFPQIFSLQRRLVLRKK